MEITWAAAFRWQGNDLRLHTSAAPDESVIIAAHLMSRPILGSNKLNSERRGARLSCADKFPSRISHKPSKKGTLTRDAKLKGVEKLIRLTLLIFQTTQLP